MTVAPTAGTPSTIVASSDYDAFPVAVRCANGDVLVAHMTGTDHVTRDDVAELLRSTDGGSTFSDAGSVAGMKPSMLTRLADGTLILGAWQYDDPGSYSRTRRSTDHGATWEAAVDVPHPWDQQGLVESIVECANGDLLALYYGWDAADSVESVGQARSADGGQSWTDEGVIFDGPAASRNWQEPQAIRLDNDDLLVMLRSDTGTKTHYSSRSSDNGATWSTPTAAFEGTGRPSCYQAADRTVLVTYRTNTAPQPMRFRSSDDRGASWSDEADFTGGSALKMMYGAFVPLAGGTTGVVYGLEASTSDTDIYWNTLATGPPSLVGGFGFWRTTTPAGSAADDVTYNNATSGLTATDVQAAIDELDTDLDTLATDLASLDASVSDGSIGRWEVVVSGTPAEAVTTEDETDWLYAWTTE